jgi:hypothetical protein
MEGNLSSVRFAAITKIYRDEEEGVDRDKCMEWRTKE